ncbi:MAG: YlbF family regulator [bacterium]
MSEPDNLGLVMAEELKKTEAFQYLQNAREKIEESEESAALLEEFREAQEEVQEKQREGSLQKEDIEEFKEVQKKILSNKHFQNQQQAAQKLQATVKELNRELSSFLDLPVDEYLAGGTASTS